MEMADNELIKQNLHCPICLLIVEEPWETSCCGTLFCEKCKNEIKNNKCAICRRMNYTFRKNLFARELLSKFDMKCQSGCEKVIKLNKLKTHKYECDKAKFKCSINSCKWEGNKPEALEHLIQNHSDLLAVVSENYPTLKPIFNKFDVLSKIMLERNIEKAKELLVFKDDKEFQLENCNMIKNILQIKIDKENNINSKMTKMTEMK